MKDNIRENLFNIIGPRIRGAWCFDLFAGTGVLAIESISRGVSAAVAVEQHHQAAKLIQQAAETLGIAERLDVITGDSLRLFASLLAPPPDDTPWCVLLCPPYAMWSERLGELNRVIVQAIENAPPGSLVVAETEKGFDVANLPAAEWDVRCYGNTQLALTEPAMVCGMRM